MHSHICAPPLQDDIAGLLAQAKSSIWIASPWIKSSALSCLDKSLARRCEIRVISAARLRDFLEQTSDIKAFQDLLSLGADIRLIENLHAKVYVIDNERAIITSANLTNGGLQKNIEIGICIEGEQLKEITTLLGDWFARGGKADQEWLDYMHSEIRHRQESFKIAATQCKTIIEGSTAPRGIRIKPTNSVKLARDWRQQVLTAPQLQNNPVIARSIVKFFENVFSTLDSRCFEAAYFGVHNHAVSATIGNLWIASVSFNSKLVYLIAENTFDWHGKQCMVKATKGYRPVKWIKTENLDPTPILESPSAWDSFREAQVHIWESPISHILIPKNLRNKNRIRDIWI